jgi:tRNA pseudouridine38-40 synthase
MAYNYKLTIAYDGTVYCGWQVQPNGIAIQEVLQKHISTILRAEVALIGSGRTDAGVHALGQVAHFHFPQPIDLYRFHGSLNGLLPADIRVKSIDAAAPDFHARYSAIGKTYHYHLHLDRVQNPFLRLYSLHVREKISLPLLKEAAKHFVGTHDFTSFANEAHTGCAAHDAVRTMRRLDIVDEEGGVRLEFEADGFLYKMVRTIVGTLLEIAAGKHSIEDILEIFASKDRRRAGKAVAPHGLFLVKVDYTRAMPHLKKENG